MLPEQIVSLITKLVGFWSSRVKPEVLQESVWCYRISKHKNGLQTQKWTEDDWERGPFDEALALELFGEKRVASQKGYYEIVSETVEYFILQMLKYYRIKPVSYFPGYEDAVLGKMVEISHRTKENICSGEAPIYIVIPWECENVPDEIKGTVLFNGGFWCDSGSKWFLLRIRNKEALKELPGKEKEMDGYLGPPGQPELARLEWLRELLSGQKPLFAERETGNREGIDCFRRA